MSEPRNDVGFGREVNDPAARERPGSGTEIGGLDATRTLLSLSPAERVRLHAELGRGLVKDKSYRALPLGLEAGHYLRAKRKRLTDSSYRDYESILYKLARYFADLEISDLEPPVGTERLEEFLEEQWGERAGRTYNKALSVLRDFFKFQVLRGNLHGDPTLLIERAKTRGVHRETFSDDQRAAILAAQGDMRDRLALRLLLDYGLRKGALQRVQFKHFDHQRRRLTIFTKSGKIRDVPIPHPAFWHDLGRLLIEAEAQPHHHLLPRQKAIPRKGKTIMHRFPDQPMGVHGLHDWWYRCLHRAGIVAEGTTSGERMHKARHSAGQRVLDKTGNLKAVQKLLGHESIQTTGDIYTDWDIDQLAETLLGILDDD
jgi:site-specific recombinase XerC